MKIMKQTIIITESPEQQGWNKNTELCMDVKTYLRSDSRMKAGKDYHGVLRRDVTCEEFHYNEVMTFVETTNQKRVKRNPHIYETDTHGPGIQRCPVCHRCGQRTDVGAGRPGRGRVKR